MFKIDKDDIQRHILETLSDKQFLKDIEKLIDEAIAELKIEVVNDKIKADDATKISNYVLEQCHEPSPQRKYPIISFLVASALGSGATLYYTQDNRYSIEQEYSLMSICVGGGQQSERKEKCVEFIKKCQKDNKPFKECF